MSFLDDEYSGDRRMRDWAESTGRLGETTTEGSDFYQTEQADPSKGFLGAFVARKRSQGLPTDLVDKGGKQVDLPADMRPIMSTQDKTRPDRLTNARAMSFKGDFENDMMRQQIDNERIRRRAELEQDRKAALEAEIMKEEKLGEIGLKQRRGEMEFSREFERSDPEYARRQALAEREQAARISAMDRGTRAVDRQSGEQDRVFAQREAARSRAGQVKPQTPAGQKAYDDEMLISGDPQEAARAAVDADRAFAKNRGDSGVKSFISQVGDFAKRDDAVFGSDPTDSEVEQHASRAVAIRNYLVQAGDDEETANQKVLEALKIGIGGRDDDMIAKLQSRLSDMFGGQ